MCVDRNPVCIQGEWDCGYPDTFEDPEDSCDLLDNDCDGDVDEHIDFESDAAHCGRCGNRCIFENARAACVTGRCEMGACLPGWVDLNASPADGCEYECTFESDDGGR